MKAWHCAVDFSDFYGGHLLVFAQSAGTARVVYATGPWEYDDFLDIRVRRAPEYDDMRDTPCCIEANDDIPKPWPPFYSDSEDEGE